MNDLEILENRVRTLLHKNQLRLERMKRLRDLNSPDFDTFKWGKIWGFVQGYSSVLGEISKIKENECKQTNIGTIFNNNLNKKKYG